MQLDALEISVVGGGIAGLAAALALGRRGASVTLFEQAPEIAEVGAGLQISPNGLRVLRALGLEAELAARAPRAQAVSLRRGEDGGEVLRLDLARLGREQGYHFVHRADLVDLLAAAARAAGVRVRLLQRVATVEDGPRARIVFENGAEHRADLVLGADGLHSRARHALGSAPPARFTGQVAWRALLPNVIGQPAEARVLMGPGRHMVVYPLRDGRTLNLVAVEERSRWAEEGWTHADDPANLRAAFAGFGGDVPAILGALDKVHVWGLFRHPVAERWHGRSVAILGDAAHPTLPFLAQGANLALEDAWVLADALDRAEDRASGLAAYQRRRRARAERVVGAAERNARRYHLRPGPVRGLAHAALGLGGRFAPGAMLAGFDWLYGHDVTAEA
ncbi:MULTISPECIES: FAD-dependent oxidoreductase [unclassified Rhodosalinus]|uniref:FAD-dependent oxidoreductase n=1 Tax=unclassified Rhodosalinus TaxID=2630183 RepID=UPI003524AB0B